MLSHSLPLFLNVLFGVSFLLCVWELQKRALQRKWDSDVWLFVLKLLSLADLEFKECELQDVVLGSSLPADPISRLFWEALSKADCKIRG